MRLRGCLKSLFTTAPKFRYFSQSTRRRADTFSEELFSYSSGRWIYNESLRLQERYLKFNVPALLEVIATAFRCRVSDIASFTKLAEGGFNRVFQATLTDGRSAIARLPYPSTVPKHYAVASEVATLDFLRFHGLPVPKVYAWSSTSSNPVGAEYIVMEKLEGVILAQIWYSTTPKEQNKVMDQVVELEARLMSLKFPASGSIYFQESLRSTEKTFPLELGNSNTKKFCIGPDAHFSWWHKERSTLDIDRGPWSCSNEVFKAVGERELAWTRTYGKPRLPYEPLYREIYNFQQQSPEPHLKALTDYLKMTPCLGFPAGNTFNRPVIRHPDFQFNNILVSKESKDILGIIDWQHTSVLPLCLAAGIPHRLQNYGDPESESLAMPQLDLPPNFNSMSATEQASVLELQRKRIVHFLYAALTRCLNEDHYHAIFDDCIILHQRLYKSAGAPWEGGSVSLQADMIRTIQHWPIIASDGSVASSDAACSTPPITYSDAVVKDALDLAAQQKEADTAMDQMRDVLDVDVFGWVSSDEDYRAAKDKAREIKSMMLQVAKTDTERIAIRDHFPFDDHDEDH